MKPYLAGPDVFWPDAAEIGALKKAGCAAYGFKELYLFDRATRHLEFDEVAGALFAGNIAMMGGADIVFANFSPFRSPSADPGTAFELGFAFALSKPVYGYSSNDLTLADRIFEASSSFSFYPMADGRIAYDDGLAFEACVAAAAQRLGSRSDPCCSQTETRRAG